jgi:hypothetical protein
MNGAETARQAARVNGVVMHLAPGGRESERAIR